MRMWDTYLKALEEAEEEWWEGDCPVEVTAVARATGLNPQDLWDRVEGQAYWVPTDTGYQGMVWLYAWSMRGHPDWQEDAAAGTQEHPARAPAPARPEMSYADGTIGHTGTPLHQLSLWSC